MHLKTFSVTGMNTINVIAIRCNSAVCNPQEHVAGRIQRAIAEEFPEFERFSVRVSKHNPPVEGPVEWSRVTIKYEK